MGMQTVTHIGTIQKIRQLKTGIKEVDDLFWRPCVWKSFWDSCPECGSNTESYTDISLSRECAYEDDPIRCLYCNFVGVVGVDINGRSYIDNPKDY